MLALLLLLLVGFVVWTLWAPAMAWVPGFAALLDRPVRKAGWLPFISGLETAGGDFEGRPVLRALHHKRGRNSLGYLIVAMQPQGTSGHGPEAIHSLHATEARSALDELETREGLNLSYDDGWLKARWQPAGFTMFPGRFDAGRWRRVLQAMSAVAASLEAQPN